MKKAIVLIYLAVLFLTSCNRYKQESHKFKIIDFGQYQLAQVPLDVDLSFLTESEKSTLISLIDAAKYADSMFLYESAGKYAQLYYSLNDTMTKLRFKINFGPWDRFTNGQPFIEGVGAKPKGANFYPEDMLVTEFNKLKNPQKFSHYTFIRRDSSGNLVVVPYHQVFKNQINKAVHYIELALTRSDNQSFNDYLHALVEALRTDNYSESNMLWLKQNSNLDFVFGPTYIHEDKLFGIKAEHQAFVLLKNQEWTLRMHKYTSWLKYLQMALPVPPRYKREIPGKSSEIEVYDAVYYGGSAHAGPVFFSETLPIDPRFQIEYGGKNMLFKNVIFAKFNAVEQPLANKILVQSQSKYVKDTAFFLITLMWEMADNLGIRRTINTNIPVDYALKEYAPIFKNLKNDLLTLFLIEKLASVNEVNGPLKQYYYTFIVDLIRQIRWGTESSFGMAALLIFNKLYEHDAIDFLPTGKLILHYDRMRETITRMAQNVLMIQGDGNYTKAAHFVLKNKTISPNLYRLLNTVHQSKIPIDIYLKQGTENLKFN